MPGNIARKKGTVVFKARVFVRRIHDQFIECDRCVVSLQCVDQGRRTLVTDKVQEAPWVSALVHISHHVQSQALGISRFRTMYGSWLKRGGHLDVSQGLGGGWPYDVKRHLA